MSYESSFDNQRNRMMSSSTFNPNDYNILDIPDEILIKIISKLNARKRLALAYSCKKFHSLVLEDEVLLKDLDFSKNGRLTTPEDIYQYFGDKNTRRHVHRVNIQNVRCMSAKMLNDTIGRATNLVNINILGIEFIDIEELASFLEPLTKVKRLSVNWPKPRADDHYHSANYEKILLQRFGELTYLSTEVYNNVSGFFSILQSCKKLEELRVLAVPSKVDSIRVPNGPAYVLRKNENIKIIQIRGFNLKYLRKSLITMLPDLEEWTELRGIDILDEEGYYFERNIEICDQLRNSQWMRNIPSNDSEPGIVLDYKSLLTEVIKITDQDTPQKFCCLETKNQSESRNNACLLKIDEAKQLLKDPGYQISFLQLRHSIEPDCDAHLFLSTFKNLKELVLCSTDWRLQSRFLDQPVLIDPMDILNPKPQEPEAPEDPHGQANSDSSFETMIENTPQIADLSIIGGLRNDKWDPSSLRLISRWTNLRALRLVDLSLPNGGFLIDIGRQCPQLEILVLHNLSSNSPGGNYSSYVLQLLIHCENLKQISIEERIINNVDGMFLLLSNNPNLERVDLVTSSRGYCSTKLRLSMHKMLRSCVKLTTFVFKMNWRNRGHTEQLTKDLHRIKSQQNRPTFQFQLHHNAADSVHADATNSFFFDTSVQFDFSFSIYRLMCKKFYWDSRLFI